MKLLPKFIILFVISLAVFLNPCPTLATSHDTSPSPSPSVAASPSPSPSLTSSPIPCTGLECWKEDPEVTFAGKLAARSADLINSVIQKYQWAEFESGKNPFSGFWVSVRNIVLAILLLFILAGAFLLIITRGQSITVRKFIPRFIIVLLLIFFSFSLIKFLYDIVDIIQGFFLYNRLAQRYINTSDLLNVAFNYETFTGLKRMGIEFEESAFMSLLLVKLTAITYYVMFIVLIVRKIILWFFIVVSPIFPLLLFFSPIRNTAKIWIGEFFRWLLYGPLFAVFLAGLVALWQFNGGGVPISSLNKPCGDTQPGESKYPTAINILIGGPCQKLTFDPSKNLSNSINLPESFMQYVVALLMLWMVILMPFLLLKIFLDYLNNLAPSENGWFKYLMNNNRPKPKPPSPLPKSPPHFAPITPPMPPVSPFKSGAAGVARELERAVDINKSLSHLKPEIRSNIQIQKSVSQILDMTKLQIPTISQVAKFETNLNGADAAKIAESLRRVAGTSSLTSPVEQDQFNQIKLKIQTEAQSGNPVAKSVDEATKNPADAKLPEENKIQTVSLEEYEEVKKTWMENYQNQEPPDGFDGSPRDRKAWLQDEIKNIPLAIDLISSQNEQKQAEGRQMVSTILPFLLLGGFSKSEVVAYLKAKLEAAKATVSNLEKEDKDEDSKLYIDRKVEEKPKTMIAEAPLPTDQNKPQSEVKEGIPVEETPDPEQMKS